MSEKAKDKSPMLRLLHEFIIESVKSSLTTIMVPHQIFPAEATCNADPDFLVTPSLQQTLQF